MAERQAGWGLLRRRELLVPTWRGWLVLALLVAVLGSFAVCQIGPFLCVTEPVSGGLLVVEGWERDYAMLQAVAEFRAKSYSKVYVTGGPVEAGAFLSEYQTYAQRGAGVLVSLGLTTNQVQAVPAPLVYRDRTYTSAVALARWLRAHGPETKSIQLMTEGPHARRSRLMFEKAFGPAIRIGIISIPEPDYEVRRWWRTSLGVRTVVGETVAYVYARFLFWPEVAPPGAVRGAG